MATNAVSDNQRIDPGPPSSSARRRRLRPADLAVFTYRSIVPGSAAEVFRWHERPEALLDLIPSRWVRVDRRAGGLRDGGQVVFSIGVGPLRVRWEAIHSGYVRDTQFCDEQVRGPFRTWRHTHRFEPAGDESSVYEDRVEYAVRGGAIARRVLHPVVRLLLSRAFARRHQLVRARFADVRDARLRARYASTLRAHVHVGARHALG